MSEVKKIFEQEFPEYYSGDGLTRSEVLYYGKEVWNAALDWAIENAKFKCYANEEANCIDEQSILKGKL